MNVSYDCRRERVKLAAFHSTPSGETEGAEDYTEFDRQKGEMPFYASIENG